MRLLKVCFVLHVAVAAAAQNSLWSRRRGSYLNSTDDDKLATNSVFFEPLPFAACLYDEIRISFAEKSSNESNIFICVQPEGSNVTYVHHLPQLPKPTVGVGERETRSAVIKCLLNEDDCMPKVDSLAVRELSNAVLPYSLVVRFEQETNNPFLLSTGEVLEALVFQPPLMGPMAAEWSDSKTLNVLIDAEAYGVVMDAHRNSETISVAPRVVSNGIRPPAGGSLSIRMSEEGAVHIYALNATTKKRVSAIQSVEVSACDSFLPIGEAVPFRLSTPSAAVSPALAAEEEAAALYPPIPLYRLGGVAAISGKNPVIVPETVAPVVGYGNWSLSFWVYLMDPPVASKGSTPPHRALFYKGDSTTSTGRTPSVWLLPDSNRLTIRVTTESEADLAVESFIHIPTFEWTLLTFVFSNTTKSGVALNEQCTTAGNTKTIIEDAAAKGVLVSTEIDHFFLSVEGDTQCYDDEGPMDGSTWFNIKAYVNKQLDVSASFRSKVLGNSEELRLFNDPSHQGPPGFAADVIVWDGLLAPSDVATLVKQGPPSGCKGIEMAVQFLNISSAATVEEGLDANEYVNYPTVLDRLLHPNDGSVDTGSLRRRSPLEAASNAPTLRLDSVEPDTSEVEASRNLSAAAPHKTLEMSDFLIPSSNGHTPDALVAEALHTEAVEAYKSCEDTAVRQDRYARAARSGRGTKVYGENMYKWAMLRAFGVEAPDTKCGVSSSRHRAQDMFSVSSTDIQSESFREQAQSFRALLQALAVGHAKAIPVLVTFLNAGSTAVTSFVDTFSALSEEDPAYNPFEVQLAGVLKEYLNACEFSRVDRVAASRAPSSVQDADRSLRPADSAFCFQHSDTKTGGRKHSDMEASDPIMQLSVGLLHMAAVSGVSHAFMALSHRYQHGIGVHKDIETAGFYSTVAADASNNAFHAVGGMPVAETDRINENTEKLVEFGNMGDDDEAIQLLRVEAEEGNVNALVNMGDLHYFGARGLPRDQPRALDYYNRAAAARSLQGMCCAAAMYLKGEGMSAANGTKAVELYTEAAELGSVKALNGLGYIYFHGTGGMEVNQSKAFECFLNATYKDEDADSWYNAGFCLQYGKGTPVDLPRAASFYKKAITKYGHFGSAFLLGNMYYFGEGVARSVPDALYYLNSINALGPWAGWVRRGLDAYLEKDVNHASLCYLHAGEVGGFEVAHSNAAFLLKRAMRLPRPSFVEVMWEGASEVLYPRLMSSLGLGDIFNISGSNIALTIQGGEHMALNSTNVTKGRASDMPLAAGLYHPSAMLRQLLLAARTGNADAMRGIGDAFYSDLYTPFDNFPGSNRSIMWYQRASARGSAVSSYMLGYMHQFGVGTAVKDHSRAEMYYSDALQRSDSDKINSVPMQILAKSMVWWLNLCRNAIWVAPLNAVFEELVARFDFFQ